MDKGNPHFMQGLMERREELLRRLKESHESDWDKVKAKFAYDYGITLPTVEKYYSLLASAGLLNKQET